MADSRPVQVRVNGLNLAQPGQPQFGSYAANEVVDDGLVKRHFPLDDQGNLYCGVRDLIPGISADADLVWHGASYTGYTNAYVKENNNVVNDWSDLINLINVLNNTPDGTYAGAVSNVVNVDEWMKYFAVNTLLDNQENSLGIGAGDDFALYRGTNDTRFWLLPYDMDSMMGCGTRTTTYGDGLWRAANVAAINRFIKRPEFVPAYFRHLKELAETAFEPARMDALLDQLHNEYVDATTIANMKAFNASHVAYVHALLPLTLNVQSALPIQSGFPRTTTATVALVGGANAIDTKTIRVNGALATYSAWEGRWTNSAVTLRPGLNRVLVQAFGPTGTEVGRTTYDVWYDDATVASVSGAIAANTTWTAAGGPYQVTASLTVNAGFALASHGDALYFFHRASGGYSLLDAVRFGLQTPDFPIGRVPNGSGNWSLNTRSPGAANAAAALGSISALRVNEWMADPASGSDWFEIYNSAAQPVTLGGLYLTDDLANKFQSKVAPLSFIGAGADGFRQFIADGNADGGDDHVSFSLKRTGESVGIYSASGAQLDAIGFGAQATGVSQGRFPDGAATFVSFTTTPSPEESNYLPLPNAVINEVLTHTDPPLEDAVELFNPTGTTTNIGGWYLSNDKSNFKKFRIADGTMLTANGYRVFYETQFNTGAAAFTFNAAHGDSAILSAADALGNLTGYRAEVSFGAAANGVSFGRYRTSVGVDFTAMNARTFGQDSPVTVAQFRTGTGLTNSGAKVGPVVIGEVMYYSLVGGLENSDDEFIELENITTSPVQLFDPAYPTNHWRLRDAVDFEFPPGITLGATSRLLVVNFTPTDAYALAAFRAKFNVPASVPVFGPFTGRLANDNDSVELVRPDAVQLAPHPDAGYVPQILVDKVRYSAGAPWPTGAASGTNSLQRLISSNYGNDPVNWQSATPTPGRANGTAPNPDADGDGMDDAWELANFGTTARDGTGDFDTDGATDLNEFLAGTNPNDPASYLRLDVDAFTGTTCVLGFRAVAGKTYSVLYRLAVDTGAWTKLADVPAQSVTGPVQVTDTNVSSSATRFYRVVTPAQ